MIIIIIIIIDREPAGVWVAEKRTNFLIHSYVVCTSLFMKSEVCQGSGGGCGPQRYDSDMEKLT